MMGIIDISRSGRLSKATVKSLKEMNEAMLESNIRWVWAVAPTRTHGGNAVR